MIRLELNGVKASGEKKVENIRDRAIILDQTELRGMVRFERSRVKAGGENVADRSGARTSRRERRATPRDNIKS